MFNSSASYIHPQGNWKFCLDFDFDKENGRPLTVFRCGKTYSTAAVSGHQTWSYENKGALTNSGTGKCVASSRDVYQGRAAQVRAACRIAIRNLKPSLNRFEPVLTSGESPLRPSGSRIAMGLQQRHQESNVDLGHRRMRILHRTRIPAAHFSSRVFSMMLMGDDFPVQPLGTRQSLSLSLCFRLRR